MVEVFKTNVVDRDHADMLVGQIHRNFACKANFDLSDCDNILRVASSEYIDPSLLIDVLRNNGFDAQILPD